MIDVSKKLEDNSLRSLKNKIINLLSSSDSSEIIALSEQLKDIFREWLVSYDEWDPYNLVSKDGIGRLKLILDKYSSIIEDGFTKDFVLRTYKFVRDGTSIDFTDQDMNKIFKLKEELEEFFFISHVHAKDNSHNSLFISRFKNWLGSPLEQYVKCDGNFDKFGDLAGMIFDYLPKEIAWYCSKNLAHLGLIK